MYVEQEDIFYYLALYNETYAMQAMPEGVEEGLSKVVQISVRTGWRYQSALLAAGPFSNRL